jgi:hypothetical protein
MWLSYASDLHLEYAVGAEQDPTNPYGRVVLTILGDGEATVTQHVHGSHNRWDCRTTRQVIDWALELLNAAGFPDVAAHMISPGATRNVRLVLGGRTLQTPEIAYHVPPTMPAYQLLFQLLDEVVAAATADAVPVATKKRDGLLA